MNRNRTLRHVSTNSFPRSNNANICWQTEMQFDQLLSHLSFIRINIDSIVMPEGNSFIQKLFSKASLYGFTLKYKFPCLDSMSAALKTPIQIPARSFSSTSINFRHKRVVLIEINSDIISYWRNQCLTVLLYVHLNTVGKYSSTLLARCTVPLADLLMPPFIISRDFDFIGGGFDGSSLIRVDIGSREKSVMEQLNSMRDDYINNTYTVDRVPRRSYSRNSLRRSTASVNQSPIPTVINGNASYSLGRTKIPLPHNTAPLRERFSSNISTETDSVFEQPLVNRINIGLYNKEDATRERKCSLQLTVHEAMGLPPVKDERGCLVPPNTYISVRGRDGELRSPVCEQSRCPRWNWTGRFAISGERRNLVVKVIHRDLYSDVVLGFVSLSLPISKVHYADYELVDLSINKRNSEDIPIVKISIDVLEMGSPLSVEINDSSARSVLSSRPSSRESHGSHLANTKVQHGNSRQQRTSSPLITESVEEINARLWNDINELERLMMDIKS